MTTAWLDAEDGPLDPDDQEGHAPGPQGLFAANVGFYRAAGWGRVFVLPRGRKEPPPRGFTGYAAAVPSGADLAEMAALRPGGNIALGMDRGVALRGERFDMVMLDVDDYLKGATVKRGGETVVIIEHAAGVPLPPTWRITSRGSGVSGKYGYLVPEGTILVTALPGVELLQAHHRYAVAPPSSNPDSGGSTFTWWRDSRPVPGGDGVEVIDRVPGPAELAVLPPEIVAVLRNDATDGRVAPIAVSGELARSFFDAFVRGEPCTEVRARFAVAVEALNSGRGMSRYEEARTAVLALLRLGEQGHHGVHQTMAALREAYVRAVANTRREDVARREFARMHRPEAVGLILAEPTPDEQRVCVCPEGIAAAFAACVDDDERTELAWALGIEGSAVGGTDT